MKLNRRTAVKLGVGAAALVGMSGMMRAVAQAQERTGDRYETDNGEIVVYPIAHASLVLTVPGLVIYADPTGGADAYSGLPPADLILITHEHGDHFDPDTLKAITGEQTKLITNPAVLEKLPEELKAKASPLGNGDATDVGNLKIEAIPAYNTTEDRKKFHPQGRDNGYVLSIDGSRVYIAGDTEDIPEMRALKDIDIAFLPMNLPYTMDIDQASSAVAEFRPANVYPYHYQGADVEAFAAKVKEAAPDTKVILAKWYA